MSHRPFSMTLRYIYLSPNDKRKMVEGLDDKMSKVVTIVKKHLLVLKLSEKHNNS